ncbi:MAG: hypothetical protein JEZ07_18945 [Phycisphaerae bacterium]|nr:hypothetical protein [Phycisphaerae bacterium]
MKCTMFITVVWLAIFVNYCQAEQETHPQITSDWPVFHEINFKWKKDLLISNLEMLNIEKFKLGMEINQIELSIRESKVLLDSILTDDQLAYVNSILLKCRNEREALLGNTSTPIQKKDELDSKIKDIEEKISRHSDAVNSKFNLKQNQQSIQKQLSTKKNQFGYILNQIEITKRQIQKIVELELVCYQQHKQLDIITCKYTEVKNEIDALEKEMKFPKISLVRFIAGTAAEPASKFSAVGTMRYRLRGSQKIDDVLKRKMNQIVFLAKSRPLIFRVIDREKDKKSKWLKNLPGEKAVDFILRNLSIKPDLESGTLDISIAGIDDVKEAAALVDDIMDQMLIWEYDTADVDNEMMSHELRDEYRSLKSEIAGLEHAISMLMRSAQ